MRARVVLPLQPRPEVMSPVTDEEDSEVGTGGRQSSLRDADDGTSRDAFADAAVELSSGKSISSATSGSKLSSAGSITSSSSLTTDTLWAPSSPASGSTESKVEL